MQFLHAWHYPQHSHQQFHPLESQSQLVNRGIDINFINNGWNVTDLD